MRREHCVMDSPGPSRPAYYRRRGMEVFQFGTNGAFPECDPHGVWLAMSIIELLCAISLVLPEANRRLGKLAPVAATCIAVEMLIFCVLDISSGSPDYDHLLYLLVEAAFCGFIAYGRFAAKPLRPTIGQI